MGPWNWNLPARDGIPAGKRGSGTDPSPSRASLTCHRGAFPGPGPSALTWMPLGLVVTQGSGAGPSSLKLGLRAAQWGRALGWRREGLSPLLESGPFMLSSSRARWPLMCSCASDGSLFIKAVPTGPQPGDTLLAAVRAHVNRAAKLRKSRQRLMEFVTTSSLSQGPRDRHRRDTV